MRHERWRWTPAGLVMLLFVGCGGSGAATTTITPTITTATAPSTTTTATAPSTTTTTVTVDPRTLLVPGGPAPVVDGTLGEEEWATATITPVDDDLSLLWLHADGSLYLGVRHTRLGSVNLLVAEGDRVSVLHSSAALGSAFYERIGDGTWGMEHGFEWCCRAPGDHRGTDALLATEGWMATIGGAGTTGAVEYRVVIGPDPIRIALTWVGPIGEVVVWPGDIPEDEWEALYGPRTGPERFVPESWVPLEFPG